MIVFLGSFDEAFPFVYIGCSTNADKLRAEAQKFCPYTLRVLREIEGTLADADRHHALLVKKGHYVRGNWFRREAYIEPIITERPKKELQRKWVGLNWLHKTSKTPKK